MSDSKDVAVQLDYRCLFGLVWFCFLSVRYLFQLNILPKPSEASNKQGGGTRCPFVFPISTLMSLLTTAWERARDLPTQR